MFAHPGLRDSHRLSSRAADGQLSSVSRLSRRYRWRYNGVFYVASPGENGRH